MTERAAANTGGDARPASLVPLAREPEWTALMQRIAAGDHDALERLYDVTSTLVYSLALRIVGDTATAEEVTLDVYTQVWRRAEQYNAGRGSPSAWLTMITRSRAIDRVRASASSHQRLVPLEATEEPRSATTPEESSVIRERRRLVRAAFHVLPQEQRQVLELAYFSELSHRAIADQLGLPPGTVKTRIRLGMVKLRESLRPLMEG